MQGKPLRMEVDPRVLSETLRLHPELTLAGTDGETIVRRKALMNPSASYTSKLIDCVNEYGIEQYHEWLT